MAIAIALLSMGCGSAPSNGSNAEVASGNPAANNANVVPYVPANAAQMNTNGAFPAPNANIPNINTKAAVKPITYPAPDDSEYFTTMDKSGAAIETRTFKKDQYIAKVTRTWKSATDKSISIYLKSGKVVSVPGDKWPDIKSQPLSYFYEAAGIKPKGPSDKIEAPIKQ
jgi:hypothetical protein